MSGALIFLGSVLQDRTEGHSGGGFLRDFGFAVLNGVVIVIGVAVVQRRIDIHVKDVSAVSEFHNTLSLTIATQSDLTGINLGAWPLSNAYLAGKTLNRAHLASAILSNANLMGTKLINANLTGADLRWADLKDADLTKADLTGADLRHAKSLKHAKLTDIVYDSSTQWSASFTPPPSA